MKIKIYKLLGYCSLKLAVKLIHLVHSEVVLSHSEVKFAEGLLSLAPK